MIRWNPNRIGDNQGKYIHLLSLSFLFLQRKIFAHNLSISLFAPLVFQGQSSLANSATYSRILVFLSLGLLAFFQSTYPNPLIIVIIYIQTKQKKMLTLFLLIIGGRKEMFPLVLVMLVAVLASSSIAPVRSQTDCPVTVCIYERHLYLFNQSKE